MIPFPYNLFALAAVAAGCFFGGWQTQGWHRDSQEKDRVTAQIETNRIQHLADTKREERVVTAQNAAQGRANAYRRDAATARGESDQLRVALNEATGQLGGADLAPDASRKHAIAQRISDLLLECTGKYQGLAETADGHVNDIRTLQDAWPKP